MCPEKERYMRVVQKRLSLYECSQDGRMAPELTVKEYSRSAADQEEPLPHELRPADVLQRTMNYLVGKIVNCVPKTDEELAQWYDFLWNRTRAIRKDITQQMMVNDTAVSLIEQCVRLHTFASHRLCELDFNEFDQKMNTENLSKSLQSLRYLYEDLAKKGIFYPSEPEFRAYEIMLNLSDSNCCLCHRYFNRMRHQAMYALSHSVQITGKYPVNKFIELLGFDDRDAVLQFLEYYSEPLRRVHSWIESKRNGQTLTKILSGGSDVDVVISTPTNSFDKRGAYVSDAVLDSYISASGTDFTVATNENEVVSHAFTLFSKANRAANESIDALAENLAAEIINAEVGRICKLIYSKSLAHPLTTTLFNQIFEDCLKSCCKEVMMAAKLHHRHKLAGDAVRDKIRSLWTSMSDSILDEVISTAVCSATKTTVRDCRRIHNEQLLDVVAKSLLDALVLEATNKYVRDIGRCKIDEGINYAAGQALAEAECERLKPFLIDEEFLDEKAEEKKKPPATWTKSLSERSSTLLDHFDKKTLETGMKIARQNLERINKNKRIHV
ncbi:unnamed protein product, partial [Gongylonema pulchrum]|uniref:SAC3_GANP domain-containing protein n=3 Tax=Gongylonema pulchrum TaxID=637853 RepID=A0A183EUS7_9BILA